MNLDLQNKQALVCGSTQGIGKAAAMELASLGANVTLVARDENILKQVVNELPNDGKQKHLYIVADFNYMNELKTKVQKHIEQYGTVHILVNNTGGPLAGNIAVAETEQFLQAFNNHLLCNHVLMQACLEGMKAAFYGRIINIISTSVKQLRKCASGTSGRN